LIEQPSYKNGIVKNETEIRLVSTPVKELSAGFTKTMSKENIVVEKTFSLSTVKNPIPNRIDLATLQAKDFDLVLSNDFNEKLIVGYDATKKQFFIDRRNAGISNFNEGFAMIATAPRFTKEAKMDLSLLIDKTAVELFADGGRTVMTALFFPTHPYTKCILQTKEGINLKSINLFSLK
jgi:fructan beta-fructosidase